MRQRTLTLMMSFVLGCGGLAAAVGAAEPPATLLVNDDFEANVVDGVPMGWGVYTDEGNAVTLVSSPALGRVAVRFTDTGGTAWMPTIGGGVGGQPDAFLRFDCDWRLTSLADRPEKAFALILQGGPNQAIVTVYLGVPGGIAVRQEQEWVSLGVPIQLNQWNHLTVYTDPISGGQAGKYTLVVTQDEDRAVFPNIPFALPVPGMAFPNTWWHSPAFSLGVFDAAGPGVEAYVDNVSVSVVPTRPTQP